MFLFREIDIILRFQHIPLSFFFYSFLNKRNREVIQKKCSHYLIKFPCSRGGPGPGGVSKDLYIMTNRDISPEGL